MKLRGVRSRRMSLGLAHRLAVAVCLSLLTLYYPTHFWMPRFSGLSTKPPAWQVVVGGVVQVPGAPDRPGQPPSRFPLLGARCLVPPGPRGTPQPAGIDRDAPPHRYGRLPPSAVPPLSRATPPSWDRRPRAAGLVACNIDCETVVCNHEACADAECWS